MTIDKILKQYTYEELKAAYAKDRKAIMSRLYLMGKTEFKRSRTYQENYKKMPKVKDLKNAEDLAAAFLDAQDLILSGFTTISAQREQKRKVLEGLWNNGYDFINEDNYWDFYEFMKYLEDNKMKKWYGSPTDEAMQTYLDALRTHVDPEYLKERLLQYMEGGQKGDFADWIK